jgi:hypothetical protein
VDAAIFHLVNDSYTPFFSEYSLKTSIRSVMKHVPWVNGNVVVVTDAYDQVQTQFRLDEAATVSGRVVSLFEPICTCRALLRDVVWDKVRESFLRRCGKVERDE